MLAGWGGPTSGAEDGEYSMAEVTAWCVLAPLSALVNGAIFVELVEITHQVGAETEKHLERLSELNAVLDSLHAPPSLKRRCMKYHCFLTIHNANRKEYEDMFEALSKRLQDEIKLHLFDGLVRSAPFFDSIPMELIHEMVISCEEEVFGPGQTIMRQGDSGSDLFFVMKGSANVFINDSFVATKEVGQYFGEMGLVYDAPRTATIIAQSFTILARLTRDDFVQVLAQATPEVRERVTQSIMSKVGGGASFIPPGSQSNCTNEDNEETTPLLSVERYDPNLQVCKNPRATKFGEVLVEAVNRKGGESEEETLESRVQRMEQHLDTLTTIVEDGLCRIQSQILQLGCKARVN